MREAPKVPRISWTRSPTEHRNYAGIPGLPMGCDDAARNLRPATSRSLSLRDMCGCDLTFGLLQWTSGAPRRAWFRQFLVLTRFDTLLYGHRPVCQVVLDVTSRRGIGCGLICGLLQAEAAGPDGIRQERPHLGRVLQAQECVQVYVLAVRPVSPSHGFNLSNLPVPKRFNA